MLSQAEWDAPYAKMFEPSYASIQPRAFAFVHIYVWEALVIALTMGVWIFWVELFGLHGSQAGR